MTALHLLLAAFPGLARILALIAMLAAGQSEDEAFVIVERAAAMEYGGGLPRDRAESRAVVEARRRRVEGVL